MQFPILVHEQALAVSVAVTSIERFPDSKLSVQVDWMVSFCLAAKRPSNSTEPSAQIAARIVVYSLFIV